MMFGYKPKPNFAVENEAVISKPPTVDFGGAAPGPSMKGPTMPPAPEPTPVPAH